MRSRSFRRRLLRVKRLEATRVTWDYELQVTTPKQSASYRAHGLLIRLLAHHRTSERGTRSAAEAGHVQGYDVTNGRSSKGALDHSKELRIERFTINNTECIVEGMYHHKTNHSVIGLPPEW